jgi:hypothetical protein
METQRPCRQRILELQRKRISQLTIKIKPYSERPNLLSETPSIKRVRLAGGDLPVGATSESEWFYPSSGLSASNVAVVTGQEDTPEPAVDGREDDRCGF